MRCLQKLCAATVPALHWGTPFQLLFALPCEDGLMCLRRCTPLGFIRPQTASHLAEMLEVSIRELAFFPLCQEAAPLPLRYCAALLQWPLVTPRRRTSITWKTWSSEDWTREFDAALLLLPVSQLFSMPSNYYQLVRGSVRGLAVSLGGLPHHLLTARMGSSKRLWLGLLSCPHCGPFSQAEHSLRTWLALSHD